MRKILVPVDGSEPSDRAVCYVVDCVRQHGPIEVHVVNVEPEPVGWQTHGMEEKAIAAHLAALGRQAMKSAQDILDAGGIAYRTHFGRGDTAQVVVALAGKLGCDAILMGTHGAGRIPGLSLGSTTWKVLHLAGIPVICVK